MALYANGIIAITTSKNTSVYLTVLKSVEPIVIVSALRVDATGDNSSVAISYFCTGSPHLTKIETSNYVAK